jgi:selenocysteine-specific elongation factor
MHVIGTAGHVDHGKSTLVQALTGIDPDRLAEEKEREMTIDLGFAWLTLDGAEVGVIDVPGHRDFIENMLAGVGGIDLALFVIAADEGVMPQTREHLAILNLLEIPRSVIALTKTDLIDDPEWLELVTLEVGETLRLSGGPALAAAPIVPVSARSGAGVAELRAALATALHQLPPPPDLGRPRLPIDRVFTLPGFGTIVTGTLLDGPLRVGDEVEVQPGGLPARIRGLQTHKTKRETALPGSRVAVNLTGVDRDDLRRGQVVAGRGAVRPSLLLDSAYRHLPDADAPLAHNAEVKLFIGAAEVTARARVIGGEQIAPGEAGWLQLALTQPVAAARGDRFILRRPTPGATLGGGHVLDPQPRRRHRRLRPDVAERFRALAQGTPEELLLAVLARSGPLPTATLLERAGVSPDEGAPEVARLVAAGQLLAIGKGVVTPAHWQALQVRALDELAQYHIAAPLRPGMEREELRSRLQLTPPLFAALRESLLASGAVAESGPLLRLPDHRVRFSAAQEAAVARLNTLLTTQGVNSPSVKECKALVGEALYFALVDLGQLRPINDEVVYALPLYTDLIARLEAHLRARGSITAAEARDVLGTSRKYAIALLEHLDELRLTRRVGDTRELVRPLSR